VLLLALGGVLLLALEHTRYQGSARKSLRCANSRKQRKIELPSLFVNGALLLLSRALLILDRTLLTPANLNWKSDNPDMASHNPLAISRALLLLNRALLKPTGHLTTLTRHLTTPKMSSELHDNYNKLIAPTPPPG
jgi:hypothetical protein